MTAIKIPAPEARSSGRIRPAYFAIAVAAVLALIVGAYVRRGTEVATSPGAVPARVADTPTRVTPSRAELPVFPAQARLEAEAAAYPAADRAKSYLGYDVNLKHPQGWMLPKYQGAQAAPVFEFNGTKLIGFWVSNTPRFLTAAEYYDPKFDPETLIPAAERTQTLQHLQELQAK